jgi:hypothetical protein
LFRVSRGVCTVACSRRGEWERRAHKESVLREFVEDGRCKIVIAGDRLSFGKTHAHSCHALSGTIGLLTLLVANHTIFDSFIRARPKEILVSL